MTLFAPDATAPTGQGPVIVAGAAPIPRRLIFATSYFTTPSGDDPPDLPVAGSMAPVTLRKAIDMGNDRGPGGLADVTAGEISFDNTDGALDMAERWIIARRPIELRVAAVQRPAGAERGEVPPLGLFTTVARLTASGWDWTQGRVRIRLREGELDVPFRVPLYGGAGGIGGPAELRGTPNPVCVGWVSNLTPQLLDEGRLLYHVHADRMKGVRSVRDGAVRLRLRSDHDTWDGFLNAPCAIGEYVTHNLRGCFRLGGLPQRAITCDVEGDGNPAASPTGATFTTTRGARPTAGGVPGFFVPDVGRPYVSRPGSVIRRLLTAYGPLTDAGLELESFAGLDRRIADDIGYTLPAGQESNVKDVIEDILRSCACALVKRPDGRRAIRVVRAPERRGLNLGATRIKSVERLDPPRPRPLTRVRVGFGYNWTVQDPGSLAPVIDQASIATGANPAVAGGGAGAGAGGGVVTLSLDEDDDEGEVYPVNVLPADRQFATREQNFHVAEDPAAALFEGEDDQLTITGYFRTERGAREVAARVKGLMGRMTARYKVDARGIPFRLELGDDVLVTFRRYGLQGGRYCLVVALEENGRATVATVMG